MLYGGRMPRQHMIIRNDSSRVIVREGEPFPEHLTDAEIAQVKANGINPPAAPKKTAAVKKTAARTEDD